MANAVAATSDRVSLYTTESPPLILHQLTPRTSYKWLQFQAAVAAVSKRLVPFVDESQVYLHCAMDVSGTA